MVVYDLCALVRCMLATDYFNKVAFGVYDNRQHSVQRHQTSSNTHPLDKSRYYGLPSNPRQALHVVVSKSILGTVCMSP